MTRKPAKIRSISLAQKPTGVVPDPAPARGRKDTQPEHPHHNLDRGARAAMAWLSGGVSAHAFIDSWTDWAFHMGHSPGRQLELAERAVATETDHIAPWRSVYKTQVFTDCDLTFVPTSGGHKSGIVNEPGNPRSRFFRSYRPAAALYVGPDDWLAEAEPRDGSWWPERQEWLRGRTGGRVPAPATGAPEDGHPPLGPAPGSFLFQT